jgi:hypothetical protein
LISFGDYANTLHEWSIAYISYAVRNILIFYVTLVPHNISAAYQTRRNYASQVFDSGVTFDSYSLKRDGAGQWLTSPRDLEHRNIGRD